MTYYKIQYKDEFNHWEDIPHKTIYTEDEAIAAKEQLRISIAFRDCVLRIIKITEQIIP